jgi:lipoprotein-releasing system permease protein
MWFLSLRLLLARKKQTFLCLTGVCLGTATFIAFAGMLSGFQDYIIDQLVNNDAHVRVSVREELITKHSLDSSFFPDAAHAFWISPPSGRRDSSQLENPSGWFKRLDNDSRVFAYSPQYQVQAIFRRSKASKSGRFIGSIPQKQLRVTNIEQYMIEGNFSSLGSNGNRLIMGDGLLKTLGAQVGETIFVASGEKEPTPFKIIGAFNFGIQNVDDTTAFGALNDVQNLNQAASNISDIAIRLTDVQLAQEVVEDWSKFSRDKVESWDQANANILSVFKIQNFTKNFVTIAILIVAAFGIYNILNILVNQKRKDIGILRAIGYEANDIVVIFLYQGFVFGILGGLTGCVFGYVLCKYVASIHIGGMMDQMLVSFAPSIYITGFLMAAISSAVSSMLPARSASKLEPIDIIRSGS